MIARSTEQWGTPQGAGHWSSSLSWLMTLVLGLLCLDASGIRLTAAPVIDGDLSDAIWAGASTITVPAGFSSDNLPMGISFLGKPYSEGLMIKLAYSYEQATLHRRPPETTPGLE